MPRNSDWYWDASVNMVVGCLPCSPGCKNCYAARSAATWLETSTQAVHRDLYGGTADTVRGRYAFNGNTSSLPSAHHLWTDLLVWPGAKHPVLGPGMPSIIFVSDMSDLFYEGHSSKVISRVVSTLAASAHIGLIMTRRTQRAAEFFHGIERSRSPAALERWRAHLWLGFSAEDQEWFDTRWGHMRSLAENGWMVFCSIAPMLGPVELPADYLRLGRWVILSGDQHPQRPRLMKPGWARAVRDQCSAAGIPFFLKKVQGRRPIPPDLLIRQFPQPDMGST